MSICPFADYKPVRNHGGAVSAHSGLVMHVQVGNNSLYARFNDPTTQVSANFWVSKTGVLEQYVDTDIIAWAEANGNASWVSVETEGLPTEALTDAQIQTLAKLYRWGHETHGWPYQLSEVPQGTGFGWHGMGGVAWGGHFDCPGDIRKAQRQQILNLAQQGAIDMGDFVDGCLTPSGKGRWMLKADGAVDTYNFDDANPAPSHGSMYDYPQEQPKHVPYVRVQPVSSSDTDGYWVLGSDGFAGKLTK